MKEFIFANGLGILTLIAVLVAGYWVAMNKHFAIEDQKKELDKKKKSI